MGGGEREKMHDTANNTFFIHRQQSEGKKHIKKILWIDLSNSIAYFTYFLSSEWKPPSSSSCVSPSCSPDRPRKPRLRRTKEWLLKKGYQVIKQIITVDHFLVFKTWPKTTSKCALINTVNWNGIITASCICSKIRITIY